MVYLNGRDGVQFSIYSTLSLSFGSHGYGQDNAFNDVGGN